MKTIAELKASLPRAGKVEWIGLRPARREKLRSVTRAEAIEAVGFAGDHREDRKPDSKGMRHATFIQSEHLPVVGELLGREPIDPILVRRNVVVSRINLVALKDRRFQIGDVVFEGSGFCHPCSRMEEILGEGGYNAMRGHGGLTARILRGGKFSVGDAVIPLLDTEN